MINEYVLGHTETLWTITGYVPEFLQTLRVHNQSLPNDKKIHVYAVDICPHLPTIHEHLRVLQKEIGALADHIQIPPLGEFEKWSRDDTLVLVDTFIEVTESETILNELETVKASIQCYFPGGELRARVREETIARNIQYLLKELDTPVLALYGGAHAQKCRTIATSHYPYKKSWVQRLMESGVSIYSLYATGIRGETFAPSISTGTTVVHKNPDQIIFSDGTTLGDIFDDNPDYNIVYIDLRSEANKSIKTSGDIGGIVPGAPNMLLLDVFDGLIVFREVTPVQVESNSGEVHNS
ncbi:MAG: hypothetical protein KAV48_06595 [Methanomicrobia archaeon]|nr:hypothetical protein [Methanomicrobia archaeon]